MDVRVESQNRHGLITYDPSIFWTAKDKSIVTVFEFKEYKSGSGRPDHRQLNTIYEFDALTLKTVGAPFEGHTHIVSGLALSFDCALLVSASRHDKTIKLWAFESRQLLASFNDQQADLFIFSPNSHQLAYTNWGETKIYIYDPPLDILTTIRPAQEAQPKTKNPDLLNLDATPRAARHKRAIAPVMHHVPRPLTPPPMMHSHYPAFLRYLRKILPSSGKSAVPPVRNDHDQPRDHWDFPATSPLPPNCLSATTETYSHINSLTNSRLTPASPTTISPSTAPKARPSRLFTWWSIRAGHVSPPIVDVPLAPGKLRYATAGAPTNFDDDLIRDEDFHYPPPNPNSQPLAAVQTNSRRYGKGLLCGCF